MITKLVDKAAETLAALTQNISIKTSLRYTALILTVTAILMAPFLHEAYLYQNTSNAVVRIVKPSNHRLGGTGFQVKAKSGTQYTITNRHVCALAENGYVEARMNDEDSRYVRLPILEVSTNTDLCILPALTGDSALSVGSGLGIGDSVYVVGHPLLEHVSITKGKATNFQIIELIVGENIAKEICEEKYSGKFIDLSGSLFDILMGMQSVCVAPVKSLRTTAPTFPGNSGSPLINAYGNVVGVIFAGNNIINWGYAVPLSDLKAFLENY